MDDALQYVDISKKMPPDEIQRGCLGTEEGTLASAVSHHHSHFQEQSGLNSEHTKERHHFCVNYV